MVVRYFCKCKTCGYPHTLRISMGHNPTQDHTFRCGSCGEEMVIHVILQPETASCEIVCRVNCDAGSEEGLIVNLHPDFPIPAEQRHQDQVFPWMQHVQDVGEIQRGLLPAFEGFASLEEIERLSRETQSTAAGWAIVRKAWSLTRNERNDLAQAELEKYRDYGFHVALELKNVLFHFCGKLIQPAKYKLFDEANKFTSDTARLHAAEFQSFVTFYLATWHAENLNRYFDVLSEYFKDFGEYTQTLMLCQYDLPLPANAVASSMAFASTKMFYGNAFETLTAHFAVLACLNNVRQGRQFDRFETMKLKKYLTVDKANRANPFRSAEPYFAFAHSMDTRLRNASHHGAMTLDAPSSMIHYRSGGSGAAHSIRYSDYLYRCNELLLRLCALLMLELVLGKQMGA